MSATNTLARSVTVAQLFLRNMPLAGAGGVATEPAFSIGDWVRQFILAPPFAWRWNRTATAFLTVAGVQDYVLTNWAASTSVAVGTIYIDPSGFQQQVTTAGITGASAPAVWNPTLAGTTTDNTATWTNKGTVGLTTALVNFGWLEKSSWKDGTTRTQELQVALDLSEDQAQNPPVHIAARLDSGTGNITFRLLPPPDKAYIVTMTYQKAAATFAALTETWSPIPDYFSYLCNQGFAAKAYEYFGDERFPVSMAMFVRQVIAANEGLSESQKNIFLGERLNTQRETQSSQGKTQTATTGRSML